MKIQLQYSSSNVFFLMTVHTVGKKKISIGVLDFVGFEVWRLPEVLIWQATEKAPFT